MTKTNLRFLTLLWALGIMTGAFLRGRRMGERLQTTGLVHAMLHIGVFAVLGLLLLLSFDTPRARCIAIFLGIALGFSTEFYEHAAFRSPMEYGDVLIDATGVFIGTATKMVRRRAMFNQNGDKLSY
jgi:hypothetical protein